MLNKTFSIIYTTERDGSAKYITTTCQGRKAIKHKHFALKLGKESVENLARERLKPIINPLKIIIENIKNKSINESTIEKPITIHCK